MKAKLNAGSCGDAEQLRSTIGQWDTFISLYKDLFGSHTRKYHWEIRHLMGRNDRPEGIRMLLVGNSGYTKLQKLYRELREEKKIK